MSAEPVSAAPVWPLDAAWRRERHRRQEAALPHGSVQVSCSAPLGRGGLGRHLQELVEALERGGGAPACVCGCSQLPRLSARERLALSAAAAPARVSTPWRAWRHSVGFDRRAAAAEGEGEAEHLIAFGGEALEQFRRARAAKRKTLSIASATAHIAAVASNHARAERRHPIERSWSGRLVERGLAEYRRADRIYVSSRYAWESFVRLGVPERSLSLFPLTPAPRFVAADVPGSDAREEGASEHCTFDVLYVGGLSVCKGVPLLIEAFTRLAHADMRLLLVGGPETRGMRRYLQRARARDPRIVIAAGDPLPALRRARLYAHPSYSDGFGYAPAEALACGVPVLVSEDTGMKELIEPGRDGLVLPTGDADALSEAIDCAYRGEILAA